MSLKSSNPFHHTLSLINLTTDVPLQRSIAVRVPGRGGGSGSEGRLRVTVRGIVTTILMVT
jgi:outer membrane receptor protein involved in Fe transport